MNRDRIIRKINLLLEDSSDSQLKYLDEELKKILANDEFQLLYEAHSSNYAKVDSDIYKGSDVAEGNYGTLYRTPD